jgi:hypothetical protein
MTKVQEKLIQCITKQFNSPIFDLIDERIIDSWIVENPHFWLDNTLNDEKLLAYLVEIGSDCRLLNVDACVIDHYTDDTVYLNKSAIRISRLDYLWYSGEVRESFFENLIKNLRKHFSPIKFEYVLLH